MFKYLLILACCIALPAYLYYNQEPAEDTPSLELPLSLDLEYDGELKHITILSHSKNYIEFLDENHNKFKGKKLPHIIHKNEFSDSLQDTLKPYKRTLNQGYFPSAISIEKSNGEKVIVNALAKNNTHLFYSLEVNHSELSIPIAELSDETEALLHYFPNNRRDEKSAPRRRANLPYKATLSATNGKVVDTVIYVRTKDEIVFSINGRYDIYQAPISKLSTDSQDIVNQLPINNNYKGDINNHRKRYEFVKKRLDSKLGDQSKFEEGSLKFKAIQKQVDKLTKQLEDITQVIDEVIS
ncbi:hypothetical protein [Rubritalea marina]|uniref:hypothetical protein n=1 Tax=Rubritalea marina TaxID=361055 RepID=UPI0003621604|nr:hypothetical protein [Rubritalea marina]